MKNKEPIIVMSGTSRDPDSFNDSHWTIQGGKWSDVTVHIVNGVNGETTEFNIPSYILADIGGKYFDRYYNIYLKMSGVNSVFNLIMKTTGYFKKVPLTPTGLKRRYLKIMEDHIPE